MAAVLYVYGYDLILVWFFFQAEDGIRDLVRSRGLGDVYKRQAQHGHPCGSIKVLALITETANAVLSGSSFTTPPACLLYTSDAADERSSVDLGGRRIIKKKNK